MMPVSGVLRFLFCSRDAIVWCSEVPLLLSSQGKIDIHEFHDFVLRVVSGKVPSGHLLIADTIQGSGGRRAGGQGSTMFH